MGSKLTANTVAKMKDGDVLWDGQVRGFGARCRSRGVTFVFRYRLWGKQGVYTIGRLGDFCRHFSDKPCTVENARREAEWARAEVNSGRAPEPVVRHVEADALFEKVAADWVRREQYGKQRANAKRVENCIANHLTPVLGGRPIGTIKRAELVRLVDKIADECGKGAARNAKEALSGIFKFALRTGRDGIETNPMTDTPAPYEYVSRDRVLSADERRTVWDAAGHLGYPWGPFVQVLMLLCQRRGETSKMEWPEVDLEKATWTIPAAKSKSRREHVVPLPAQAVAILADLPRPKVVRMGEPQFVFSCEAGKPIAGFQHGMRHLLDLTGPMKEWHFHDLRRTGATGMAELGVDRFIIGRVLNHADSSVTGVYDRYAYLAEKRAALQQWADAVEARSRDSSQASTAASL